MERNAALMTARGGRREGQGPGATRAQVLCIISLNLPGNKNQWRHLLKLQILGSLLWALWFQFDKHGTELHQESAVLNKILGCAGRARGGAERVCRFLPSSSCQHSVYVVWLLWSPDGHHCSCRGATGHQQCGPGRPLGRTYRGRGILKWFQLGTG